MLAGRLPFAGTSREEACDEIRHREVALLQLVEAAFFGALRRGRTFGLEFNYDFKL